MTDRQSTHGHFYWGWGQKHYECAVREIERLREQLRLATVDQATAEAEANDARAEIEELRKDAERWRALREMDGGEIYALLGDCDGIHPEQADAAIDQARGKGGKEVGE
jgi:hypothetical protein